MNRDQPVDVGVIGVGSMGEHHARVYDTLPRADLTAVYDIDDERARKIAREYETESMSLEELLEIVDAASVVVPTSEHYEIATRCLRSGVAPLIEKPVVEDLEQGRKLRSEIEAADVPLQVGHVERFNPAVLTLRDMLTDLSIISISAHRLGPTPERDIDDTAVLDLMIHDIDVVLSIVGQRPIAVKSSGVNDNHHVSALLEFGSDSMASLTASRLTQRKVRKLEVTAENCLVELDYIDQSINVYRNSIPEYIANHGDVRFRHESIVERVHVPNEEPLRNELASFLAAVAKNETPEVTIDDGLAALEIAREIDEQ